MILITLLALAFGVLVGYLKYIDSIWADTLLFTAFVYAAALLMKLLSLIDKIGKG